MSEAFTVEKRQTLKLVPSWSFCFNGDITGVGDNNKRFWDTKDELIDALTALGITPDRYLVKE